LFFEVFIEGTDLFLGLEEVFEFDAIQEVEVVLDSLEGVDEGSFEVFLAFDGFLFEFGDVFVEFLFHGC
jgi:hypothetical protein